MFQKGDTLAFSGNSLVSWIIKIFTRSKFSHVAIVVDNKNCMEALKEGVVVTPIEEILKRKERIYLYPLGLFERKEFNESRFDHFCWQTKGKKYDYLQAIKSAAPPKITDIKNTENLNDKYFCSEFCVRALEKAGVLNKLDSSDYSPEELLELNIFDKPTRLK